MSSPRRGPVSPLRGPGEVAEDEATGELAATYARLREALGVPFIPTVHRMLGVYERYLAAAVDAGEALIAGEAGARFAVQARRTTTVAVADLAGAPLEAGAERDGITGLIDRYNEANPRNLLFVVALTREPSSAGWQTDAAPPGEANAAGPVMPPDLPAAGKLHTPEEVLADVLTCHGGFTTPGFWRELADWPELLTAAWSVVRPLARDRSFQHARAAVRDLAGQAAGSVRPPHPGRLGYGPEDAAAIGGILSFFEQAIASMIVEIEIVRGLLPAVR